MARHSHSQGTWLGPVIVLLIIVAIAIYLFLDSSGSL
jgi:hypothetical protein